MTVSTLAKAFVKGLSTPELIQKLNEYAPGPDRSQRDADKEQHLFATILDELRKRNEAEYVA